MKKFVLGESIIIIVLVLVELWLISVNAPSAFHFSSYTGCAVGFWLMPMAALAFVLNFLFFIIYGFSDTSTMAKLVRSFLWSLVLAAIVLSGSIFLQLAFPCTW